MKYISIEVPPNGTSVQLVLRGGVFSGQVVIVASDDVDIRPAKSAPVTSPQPGKPAAKNNGKAAVLKSPSHDLDTVIKRLTKLKPTSRTKAVNCIKAINSRLRSTMNKRANPRSPSKTH